MYCLRISSIETCAWDTPLKVPSLATPLGGGKSHAQVIKR